MPLKCCLVFGIFALFTVCLPTVFCEQVFVKIDDSLDAVVSCKETISTLTVKIYNFSSLLWSFSGFLCCFVPTGVCSE